jgi:hypothetical protein
VLGYSFRSNGSQTAAIGPSTAVALALCEHVFVTSPGSAECAVSVDVGNDPLVELMQGRVQLTGRRYPLALFGVGSILEGPERSAIACVCGAEGHSRCESSKTPRRR